jgi:hypothetical protein
MVAAITVAITLTAMEPKVVFGSMADISSHVVQRHAQPSRWGSV